MQNAKGQNVDLYIPRKCSWTNKIIGANAFGSVQLNVGLIDPETGLYTKEQHSFALSGAVRSRGEADEALNTLVSRADEETA